MSSVCLTHFIYLLWTEHLYYLTDVLFDFPASRIQTADVLGKKKALIQQIYNQDMTDCDTQTIEKLNPL